MFSIIIRLNTIQNNNFIKHFLNYKGSFNFTLRFVKETVAVIKKLKKRHMVSIYQN